ACSPSTQGLRPPSCHRRIPHPRARVCAALRAPRAPVLQWETAAQRRRNMASDPVAKLHPRTDAQASPGAAKAAQPMAIGARGPIYTVTAGQGANAADLINASMISKVVGKTTQRR